MSLRSLKGGYFILEALNSFATTFFFYYLFFFMAQEHGFGNAQNLVLAAVNGFVYMAGAWAGGRLSQRWGYYRALGLGFGIMGTTLAFGGFLETWQAHVAVMILCTAGMCLTWPTLQALISEGENPYGLQRMVGLYNLIWAGTGGVAFFVGGSVLETLGRRSLFWLPVFLHAAQLVILALLKNRARTIPGGASASEAPYQPSLNPRPIARARTFLKLAWFANPFAYVAVNTVVAVIPGIAERLELTPKLAGFYCSIWFFARLGTFCGLWLWSGWHYRFRWFLAAYLTLIAGFSGILLSSSLWLLLVAQAGFGTALGLIYYSSLYYSMDVGEAKAEQGGIHEAAIGCGIFVGPAVGASALYIFPNHLNSGSYAVSLVLLAGLAGLLVIRYQSRRRKI